jgi:hypothetical protein
MKASSERTMIVQSEAIISTDDLSLRTAVIPTLHTRDDLREYVFRRSRSGRKRGFGMLLFGP